MADVSHGHGAVVLLLVGGVLGTSVAGCAGGAAVTGDIVGGVYQEGGLISI